MKNLKNIGSNPKKVMYWLLFIVGVISLLSLLLI